MSQELAQVEAMLLPIKGMVFDLPEEQRDKILKIKAAVMLSAGPTGEGLLGALLAVGELCKLVEKEPS